MHKVLLKLELLETQPNFLRVSITRYTHTKHAPSLNTHCILKHHKFTFSSTITSLRIQFIFKSVPGPPFGRLLIQARSLFTALSLIIFSLLASFLAKCSSAPPAAILDLWTTCCSSAYEVLEKPRCG